jgi:hypothetical protein
MRPQKNIAKQGTRLLLLMCSLTAGFVSVVVGQRILAIENAAITISHCQRLNLQNIFFLNQSQQRSIPAGAKRVHQTRLPRYCDKVVPLAAIQKLDAIANDDANPAAGEETIRAYADALSTIEDHDSELKRNLLIALVAFNVIALSIEALILYGDRQALEADSDG